MRTDLHWFKSINQKRHMAGESRYNCADCSEDYDHPCHWQQDRLPTNLKELAQQQISAEVAAMDWPDILE